MEQINIIGLLDNNTDTLNFMGQTHCSELVQEQTMHQVFKVDSDVGNFYVKIGKSTEKDKGAREMKTEAEWYRRFKHDFKIENAPDAIYAVLGEGVHVMAVEEVVGDTYDEILRRLPTVDGKMGCLHELMWASAEVSRQGYLAYLKDKENTPAYFGEFDEGEASFLIGRTLKILRASLQDDAESNIKTLESALKNDVMPLVVDERFRSFYRDAIPQNWIRSDLSKNVVPIDLGSTSYRPIQFELVALIETPKSGLDELTEQERDRLVRLRWKVDQGDKCSYGEFDRLFQMASFLKNWSGVASRIQHIKNNKEKLDEDIKLYEDTDMEMFQNRLKYNLAGRNFHIARALAANEKLLKRGYVAADGFKQTKHFLEELKEGRYIYNFFL